jgi:hypothetical protein
MKPQSLFHTCGMNHNLFFENIYILLQCINKIVFQNNVVHLLRNQLIINKGSRINYNKPSINFEFDQELKRRPILNIIQT